jgi:outer membrane protein assembly factor BamB
MRGRVALAAVVVLLAGCTSSGTGGPTATEPATTPPTTPPTSASAPAPSSDAPQAQGVDWPTYHGRLDRAGYAPSMPTITGTPRIAADLKLDAAMYASPVVVGGVVIAATEGDTVYAFDLTGHKKWEQHLGSPATADELPCGNIDPLGITGTPVVADGTVYVAAEYGSPPRHELVALDLDTGAVRWRRSIDLPGVETRAMQERGALTVTGGRVWVPFGGLLGDCGGYKGRVIGVRLDGTGAPLAYTVPTTREAGIWTPPGPSVDADGNLFVQVGNGEAVQGDPYDHSDSVLKISPSSAQLLDSFSPSTWASDNAADLDLGSQGPALVGARWVFAAGKSGTAYVLDQHHLGGIGGEVSQAALCHSYGGTAVVGDVVYVPCTDGVRAVRIDDSGTMHPLWRASDNITGSPVVGGGRVWTVDPTGGVLYALDPQTGESGEQLPVGETSRFATPALYGRYVLVPTMSGLVIAGT